MEVIFRKRVPPCHQERTAISVATAQACHLGQVDSAKGPSLYWSIYVNMVGRSVGADLVCMRLLEREAPLSISC